MASTKKKKQNINKKELWSQFDTEMGGDSSIECLYS